MLVNAAGFGKTGTVEEIAKEDKKLQLRMIDLNCRGLTEMTCTCLPWMHKGTRIINLASAAAFCPQAKFCSLCSDEVVCTELFKEPCS